MLCGWDCELCYQLNLQRPYNNWRGMGGKLEFIFNHLQRQNASIMKHMLQVLNILINKGHCLYSVPLKILVVFIKREEFDKAEEMLNKYFPRSRVGKVSEATCLVLIIAHPCQRV